MKKNLEPFRHALAERGWVEGQSVAIEYRHVLKDSSQGAQAAAEFARAKVDVIFADGAPWVRAARAATQTIPIIGIDYTTDPVVEGYAKTYGRPGGNVTGVFLDAPDFAGKWFQLLKAIVPRLSRVGVLWDPSPGTAHLQAVQAIARSLRVQVQVVEVHKAEELDRAFSALRERSQALILLPSPMIYSESERLAKLSLKHRLPATSMARTFADAGGTLAYGPEQTSVDERCAVLVAKVLAGTKPGNLPVERPTKVQLVVNLKTAKALGLTIPESVLYRADEVIR
jgi:putative ABC transport system substrate-binding protein